MAGRYGSDQFNFALLVLCIIISIVARFTPIAFYLSLAGYVPLVFAIYRMFSKNIYKRQQENAKFMSVIYAFLGFFKKSKEKIKCAKYYKYFKCPNCRQELRVPKGKGKIIATCPKCSTKFEAKS